MIQLFLQNAWSPVYAGRRWPRHSWLKALHASRSGQRLRVLTAGLDVEYYNTTPEVGNHPDSVLEPCSKHIKSILDCTPTLVVACGKQAEKVLSELWAGPLLSVPHPAHRLVTNALYIKANECIKAGWSGRGAMRQKLGNIEMVTL